MADGFGAPAFGGAGASPFQIVRPEALIPGVHYPSPDPFRQGLNAFFAMSEVNRRRQQLEQKMQEFQIREALMAQQHTYELADRDRRFQLASHEAAVRDMIAQGHLEDADRRTQSI